ncbi:MAG TPA: phosphopentomutase [Chthoniobacterales bacterium]
MPNFFYPPKHRAILLVLDSAGCGNAPDAANYGDAGADTLGHLLAAFPNLAVPALKQLGLETILSLPGAGQPAASFGTMTECSAGKDTTTGHWEIAGVILTEPFSVFWEFPLDLVDAIEREAGVRFIGNVPASGTEIIERLGDEHLRTGRPILYTSADSVLQIAAHEEIVPLEELYAICQIARKHADPHRIGRVIARPFCGPSGGFRRTANRHDYSFFPPPTILNALEDAGIPVTGVGKISDLFAGSGVSGSHPTGSNREGMEKTGQLWKEMEGGLLFVNLVDFDTLYGHRRDAAGYARALEEFDAWLGGFLPQIQEGDLFILTADHGNDPTHPGSDHTRERVPLCVVDGRPSRDLGIRETYADVAASLAEYFGLPAWPAGRSFLA